MNIKAAETFHPGEFLKDELEARDWSQVEFAEIIGRPPKLINQIIAGKSGITPETATDLAAALNTSPEFWLNLHNQYLLSKINKPDNIIQRKAYIHEAFPIKDMLKRSWILASENIDVLEANIKNFFNISEINKIPTFGHAAKKTSYESGPSVKQIAWLIQSKKMAEQQVLTNKFTNEKLINAINKLSSLLYAAEEIRHVPKILAEAGVRFVILESLPSSKIDGACFWLSNDKPVIALSLRFDRIDNFWFVLRHEIEHILQGDGKTQPILDEDVGINTMDLPPEEKHANEVAAEFCVPQEKLVSYIERNGDYKFVDRKIQAFAGINKIHPGIIVGQLHSKTGQYNMQRKHLVKIKNHILPTAYYNGWGDY